MQPKMEPIAAVKPYPGNPRKDHDVEGIARSLEAFGWQQPIVVWDGDGMIVAGHGRYLAAKSLGLDKVWVKRIGEDELTATEVAAYRLADNRTAEQSTWDEAALLLELDALDERERELAGFDAVYLDDLRRRQELEQLAVNPAEDEVPEPPTIPVSRLGDLWVLGEHKLLCGDATSEDDVSRLGEHGHLMVTDPPYGVGYDPDWRNQATRPNGTPYGAKALGEVLNDERAEWLQAWQLYAGDVAYAWSASGANLVISGGALINAGFELRSEIIWRKQHFAIGRGNYHFQHESCWYAVRKGRKSHWRGDRTQSTVWDVANASAFGGSTDGEQKTAHSTQKPVEVMRRPMVNNSNHGELVYDPFVGSGTTIIAAESVGRQCRAIELEPTYVDMSVLRWRAFTGKAATLDGTDQTFDQLRDLRAPQPVAGDAA